MCYDANMNVRIEKQKRKTIVLKMLDADNAVLRVPLFLTKKQIDEFLESKTKWMEKASQKILQNNDLEKNFLFDRYIYLDGCPVAKLDSIAIGFDKLSDIGKRNAVRKYYKSMFWKLEKLADRCRNLSGLTYDAIKPLTSVKIWGSYNTKRVMKLNWKLVILPEELAFYVICHELAHSVHFNHKPQFWKEVERMCPNYKELKKKLGQYAFLLKNDL